MTLGFYFDAESCIAGCTICADLRELGEEPSCVASCPMRAIEFGDIDELRAKHADENLSDHYASIAAGEFAYPTVIRPKKCMADPDYDEFAV